MYTHTDIYMDRSSMDISTFGESSQGVLAFSGLRTTDFEISCHFYTVSLSLRNKHCKRTLQNKFFLFFYSKNKSYEYRIKLEKIHHSFFLFYR